MRKLKLRDLEEQSQTVGGDLDRARSLPASRAQRFLVGAAACGPQAGAEGKRAFPVGAFPCPSLEPDRLNQHLWGPVTHWWFLGLSGRFQGHPVLEQAPQ